MEKLKIGEQEQQPYISDKLWEKFRNTESKRILRFFWNESIPNQMRIEFLFLRIESIPNQLICPNDFLRIKSIPNQLISKKNRKASDRLDHCDLSSDK